jgi:hypothetical protein
MKTARRRLWIALLMLPCAAGAEEAAQDADSWLDALRHGEWHIIPRYRYEDADDDAFAKSAHSSTLRTRLNYRTAAWRGWTALIEGDDVRSVGADQYNSTRNGQTGYPIVADPEGTDLNQALLAYADERYSLTLGRQRMTLDDHRFVSPSSWRQNEQTFDAATGRVRLAHIEALYSYVDSVERVFGPDPGAPPGRLHSDSHVLNLRIAAGPVGSIVAFAYLLDFDNAPAQSSDTYGLLWTGTVALTSSLGLVHVASYAEQTDAGDNPTDFRAHYSQLQLGLRYRGWTALIGRDVLSGDATRPNRAFQTPLAGLHLFQGWADKFLNTPPQGINDDYASLSGAWRGFNLQVTWHRFEAQAIDRDYGEEWDVSVSRRFATHYDVLLKAADYSSRGFAADTAKWWVQFVANF